jgi:hypothetical protein
MQQDAENNLLTRAKADLAEFDRRIAVTQAEEERLATERQRMATERVKVVSFIEMFERYAGAAIGLADHANDGAEAIPLRSNGADHLAAPSRARNSKATRQSGKRGPPLHRKPVGTPTTSDMILSALRDAGARGEQGLAPKDIAQFIRQKWWPHLKGSSVGPAAWRLYRDKQIRKEGGLYAPITS